MNEDTEADPLSWPIRKKKWDQAHYFASTKRSGRAGHLSQAEVNRLRNLRASGKKVYEICDEVGVSRTTVTRHTKDLT